MDWDSHGSVYQAHELHKALAAVNCLPESFSSRWVPGMMSCFSFESGAYSGLCWVGETFLKRKNDICRRIRDMIATENMEKPHLDVGHPTIFHEILFSKLLPTKEKTSSRLPKRARSSPKAELEHRPGHWLWLLFISFTSQKGCVSCVMSSWLRFQIQMRLFH